MKIPETIIEDLVSRVEIEVIYQFSYQILDKTYQRLIIVPNSNCTLATTKLKPIVELFLEEAPEFTFQIIPFNELKTDFKMGQLLQVSICIDQNMIYKGSNKMLRKSTPEEVNVLVRISNDHFDNGHKKATDFMKGVHFYFEQGNFQQAAFMLHQSAEIYLKGITNAIIKIDRQSHSILDHLKFFSRYIPELGKIFTEGNVFRYEPLKLLDKAYINVRYKNNFEITEQDLSKLVTQVENLIDWGQKFYDDCIAKVGGLQIGSVITGSANVFSLRLPTATGFEENKLPILLNQERKAQLVNELEGILEQHSIVQINLIGYRTFEKPIEPSVDHSTSNLINHYFVLAVLKEGEKAKSRTISKQGFKLTILFQQEETIKYALERKNRFFIQSLSAGVVLYNIAAPEIKFAAQMPDWPHSFKRSTSVWKYRLDHAQSFFNSATIIVESNKTAREPALILLGNSIEQACIGFIYVHTGYYVDNCSLPFLFNFCNLINPELTAIINDCKFEERRTRNALFTAISDVRYKTNQQLKISEISFLLDRCQQFLAFVEVLCAGELKRMEELLPRD